MSVDVKLVDKNTFNEKMDNIALAILGLSATQGGQVQIKTWQQIQQIVRMGLAPKFFSIGDILYVEKESAISATSSNSGITVSVDEETFIAAIGESGTLDYEATYDGIEWHDEQGNPINLANFGVTLSGSSPQEGDKIVIHETADSIPMVVVGFDQETPVDTTREHSMSLLMLNTFTGVVFSATQALFQFPDGLAAGSYAFSIDASYESAYGGGSTLYFTLTQAIPAGGQIYFPWGNQQQASATKITTYASASATSALESNVSVSTTEIAGATNLGTVANSTIQSVTVGGVSVKINNVARARYGNNNWKESAIRQWCNSSVKKGSVWTPQNIFDRAPSWVTTLDGFMHGLDPHLVSAIGKVKKTTLLNNVTDGGGNIVTEETCWLMSMGEMGVSGFSAEGSQYDYYKKLLGGLISDWSTHSELIKTNKAGNPQYWWLRSPDTGYSSSARCVGTSGYVSSYYAFSGFQAVVGFAII